MFQHHHSADYPKLGAGIITYFISLATMAIGFGALLFGVGCSSQQSKEDLGQVSYVLDRGFSNKPSNILRLNFPEGGDTSYWFSIEASDVTSTVEQGTIRDPIDQINLSVKKEGLFAIKLNLFYGEKVPFATETMAWDYSTKLPPQPIISFSEDATSDQQVYLLLAGNLINRTSEIWVEGDIEGAPAWHKIPDDNSLPITVSEPDGLKTLKVKYLNLYGSESASVTASILKKSVLPLDCEAIPIAKTVRDNHVDIYMKATNEGPLWYLISGDLANSQNFVEFKNQVTTNVELSPGPGTKQLSVQIRDMASNYCPIKNFNVTVDPNYKPEALNVIDHPIWTEVATITLDLHFDHLPLEEVLMYISGDIEASASTQRWIPHQPRANVLLKPKNGTRYIRVKYQRNGVLSGPFETRVYLNPMLILSKSASQSSITVSDIIGLKDLSITGCGESYQNVSYQAHYPCTPNEANIKVVYRFNDGSTLEKTEAVP